MKAPLFLILLGCPVIGFSASTQTEIVSPPLEAFNKQRVSLSAPSGWHILSQDESTEWQHIEYDFKLAPVNRADPVLSVEVITWPTARAERKGALTGARFSTHSGLRGVFQADVPFDSMAVVGQRLWTFAVRFAATDSVLFVGVTGPKDSAVALTPAVRRLFRSLRFRSAPSPNHALQRTATGSGLPAKFYASSAGSRR